MSLSAGQRLGPYEILAPLGTGGMGEVYRALDERLGREVAIKVLPAELSADSGRLKRFEKEARSASSLNHPNIVTIHEIARTDSISYIVMELVSGKTLRELLLAGPLPTRKVLSIGAETAEGLAKAHAAGIVHRDLKPENLMVTENGHVKILDFGLAKLTQPDVSEGQQTHAPTVSAGTEPGVVMGTVGYMSPEQASGLVLDFRSDQFSFGSVLYELATGKPAFEKRTRPETLAAIIREEPEPMASLAPKSPAPLRWIVERCLAKEARERYASTEDLARDLESLRGRLSEVSGSGEALPVQPGRRGLRVAPVVLAAGALATLAVGLLAGRWTLRTVSRAPTFQRLTFRRGTIWAARFAPDGQTIVYDAAWEGNPSELFSTRPGAAESRPLGLGRARLGAVSSLGELAFFLDPKSMGGVWTGTLARAPLAGGQPREVLENIHSADWSSDGTQLAIVRDVGARSRLEYPPGRLLGETPGVFGVPRVSATGDQVAVAESADRLMSNASVVVVDRAGRRRSLARHDSVWAVAWSPKGDEVWFNGSRQGETRASLFAVTLAGKERLLYSAPISLFLQDVFRDGRLLVTGLHSRRGIGALAPGETTERDLSWLDGSAAADLSADGKTLLFNESGEGGGASETVYLRKTDGSPAKRLGEGWASALSPDGKWALTIPPDGSRLLLLPTGAGEVKTVTYTGLKSVSAAWSFPDGRRALLLASERGPGARLFIGDLDGRGLRPVTPEGTSFYGVCISPDGRFVTAIGPDRMAMIYAVEGGASPRPVAGLSAGDTPIRFTSDGKSLFTMRLDEVPARVFRVDLATGQRQLFRELAPPDRAGLLPITAVRMTPDGTSYAYNYLPLLGDLYLVGGLE